MAVKTKLISVQDWVALRDNPRQRDTARRAEFARNHHLAELGPTHECVNAAAMNGSLLCKLDGHTRARLWDRGDLEVPHGGKVHVTIYQVESLEEAATLYEAFDSPMAVEKAHDRIYGACREQSINLSSALLVPCKWNTALKFADKHMKSYQDTYDAVCRWKKYIIEVDSWGIKGNGLIGPVLSAALLIVRKESKHRDKVKSFFIGVSEDGGTRDESGSDGIHALCEHVKVRSAAKKLTGSDNISDIIARVYTCWKAYKTGRRIKAGIKATNTSPLYVE